MHRQPLRWDRARLRAAGHGPESTRRLSLRSRSTLRRLEQLPAEGARIIRHLGQEYGLADHGARLRSRGFLTSAEMATRLGVSAATVASWRRAGILQARPSNDHGEFLESDHVGQLLDEAGVVGKLEADDPMWL